MVAPRPWLAPTSSLATAFIRGKGGLRGGSTGTPLRCHGLDLREHPLGFLPLGGGKRHGPLVSHLSRVHHQNASFGCAETPVRVLHWHAAHATAPMPVPRRRLPGPPRLGEQARPPLRLLAPGLQLLPHPTGARHQGHAPDRLLQAQPARACTIGRTIGHKAPPALQAQR
jgi:hypothetical protein